MRRCRRWTAALWQQWVDQDATQSAENQLKLAAVATQPVSQAESIVCGPKTVNTTALITLLCGRPRPAQFGSLYFTIALNTYANLTTGELMPLCHLRPRCNIVRWAPSLCSKCWKLHHDYQKQLHQSVYSVRPLTIMWTDTASFNKTPLSVATLGPWHTLHKSAPQA